MRRRRQWLSPLSPPRSPSQLVLSSRLPTSAHTPTSAPFPLYCRRVYVNVIFVFILGPRRCFQGSIGASCPRRSASTLPLRKASSSLPSLSATIKSRASSRWLVFPLSYISALSSSCSRVTVSLPLGQYTHQTEPAFCGITVLVMVLNSLSVDPARIWKKPWRWFSEDMMGCCRSSPSSTYISHVRNISLIYSIFICRPLDEVKRNGITLDEFHSLAVCKGLNAPTYRFQDRSALCPSPILPLWNQIFYLSIYRYLYLIYIYIYIYINININFDMCFVGLWSSSALMWSAAQRALMRLSWSPIAVLALVL